MLLLTLYALAVARITRLVNADKITDRLRLVPAAKLRSLQTLRRERMARGAVAEANELNSRILRWDKVVYYVSCPWCVGMWVALGTVWAPLFLGGNVVVQYLLIGLAVSHLVGVFAQFADTEEIEIVDDDDDDDQ
ncbi:hypothetical protein SEA_ALANGRANT_9 [Mycobacterium phage AlanGrant]|uniref:DUF1360 domain-containing protein n=1 Tax=Mycobacterium phage AlanGrant TaxID=1647307 RepID=A0A0F6YRC0_9CAUD|nr:hypothetical protein SEA_ALANGRANT_9 [Mycobacterium phage AlanGrant]